LIVISLLQRKGLVLGVYEPENEGDESAFTPAASAFQGQIEGGRLQQLLKT
jgi:hypothetical protein